MSAPSRRRVLGWLAAPTLLGACGQGEPAGPRGSPFDNDRFGDRAARAAAPRIEIPPDARPLPGAPDVALRTQTDDAALGWARTRWGAIPFALSGLRDGRAETPPLAFFGGDRTGWDATRMLPLWRRQANRAFDAAGIGGPRLILARPYAGSPAHWRKPAEWRMMAAARAALGDAFDFDAIDVLGHSSGGTLGFALAQETSAVRLLVGAAPPLSVVAWNSAGGRAPAPEVLAQYDPVAAVAKLDVLRAAIVADPRDSTAPPAAWRGYLTRARALGKPVAYVKARGGGPDRHGVLRPAAQTMQALRDIAGVA